jgi:hypothetical protein
MKYLKNFESSIEDRLTESNYIKYNIECLLMDLTDSGIKVNINNSLISNTFNIKIDTRSGIRNYNPVIKVSRKKFTNIVDYLLSLIDYMKTVDYNYRDLKISLGTGYKQIRCRIVDGKIKKILDSGMYIDDDRFIADYLVGFVDIEFIRPMKRI